MNVTACYFLQSRMQAKTEREERIELFVKQSLHFSFSVQNKSSTETEEK